MEALPGLPVVIVLEGDMQVSQLNVDRSLVPRLTFIGLVIVNLILMSSYVAPGVISNDDYFTDPGHMYIRDARWGAIPWLHVVDAAFESQLVAKSLAWFAVSITAAMLATLVARIFAKTATIFVGLALVVSLALMSSQNLRWGPAIWYNAASFFWLSLALLGLLAWHRAGASRLRLVAGVALWAVGVLGAAVSYQAFAIIGVLAWLSVSASREHVRSVAARVAWIVIPPVGAVLGTAGLIAVLNALTGSSRLDQAGESGLVQQFSIGSLFVAYSRPPQVALGWAIAILAVLILWQVFGSRTQKHHAHLLSSLGVLAGSGTVIVALPLLLEEASLGRFASTIQIAVLVGLAAQAVMNSSDGNEQTASPRQSLGAFAAIVVATALAGLGLAVIDYPILGATLGLILVMFSFLLLVLWAVGVPRTPQAAVALVVISSLLVSYATVREQLFRNWVDVELDNEVANSIALEISRLDLSPTELIQVSYDVVGKPSWSSPLLREFVSGVGVLQFHLDGLRDISTQVVHANGVCEGVTDDTITVTRMSSTEVTVCVNVDTVESGQ